MHWLKSVKKVLLGLLVAVAVSLLIFVGINQIDEDLNPTIKSMLEVPAMSVAAEQNGYYFLLGFGAAADKDPHAVGMEIDKRVRAHFSNSDSFLVAPKIDETLAGKAPLLPQDIRHFCDPRKGACLDTYLAASRLADLEQAAALYLKRYTQLIAYPGYEDRPLYTFSNDMFPSYADLSFTSQLFVARAAQSVAANKYREGAERIANDMRFWRRALQGSKHVLGKMIAVSRMTADLKLINELIARYPAFAKDQTQRLAEMTQPLSAAEIDYCAVNRHERAAAFRQLHALGQTPWQHRQAIRDFAGLTGSSQINLLARIAPVGYVPHATLNLMFSLNEIEAPVCSVKPALLASAEKEATSRTEDLMRQRTGGLAMFYNPMGKSFLNAMYPAIGSYRYRLHDLDGYLRATALHARIHAAKNASVETIPSIIAQAEAAYHDPYTDKPIVWNAAEQTLTVTQNASPNTKEGGVAVIRLSHK